MNFFILFTKSYINRKKHPKDQIYLIELLNELKIKMDIIKLSNLQNNREHEDWIDQLNDIL